MLFSSFGHRLLLVFGIVFFFTLLVVGSASGLFGETASALLQEHFAPLLRFYSERKELIDPSLKWAGFLVSLYGVVWTVHKSWHYAERNLPARLKDYNERWKDAVETSRVDVIPALTHIASLAPAPVVPLGLVGRLRRWVHDPEQKAFAYWEEKLAQHENEFSVLTSSKVRCRAEVVTANLALGTRLARVGPEHGTRALAAFQEAHRANRSDLDALELVAKQSFALKARTDARTSLTALEGAALRARKPIRQSRAKRFYVETLELGQKADRERARGMLTDAIAVLSSVGAGDVAARDEELGLVNLLLAEVQIGRERFRAARSAFNVANQLLRNSKLLGVKDRLTKVGDQLDNIERDPENDEIAD